MTAPSKTTHMRRLDHRLQCDKTDSIEWLHNLKIHFVLVFDSLIFFSSVHSTELPSHENVISSVSRLVTLREHYKTVFAF